MKKNKRNILFFLLHNRVASFARTVFGYIINVINKNRLISLIIFVALLVRLWGLLPNNLYHPDEPWVQVYAQKLFYNIITKGDFDPHDYKYGSFIIYLEALPHFPVMGGAYLLEWFQNTVLPVGSHSTPSFQKYIADASPTQQYFLVIMWMQRALVALLGALSVPILYLFVKKLIDKNTALLAALLFAVAPVHVRDSHYITTDVPLTFFTLLAMLFMVNLFQSGKLKWYVLSGLTIGFSSTVRYFPIIVLAYPIAVLMDKQKDTKWILKILIGGISIFIGVFIGLPFLFLHPQNKAVFQMDMEKYILPWYETTISDYASSLVQYITSKGHTTLPNLTSLYPVRFRQFYLSFLFFQGFGQIPSIAAALGVLIALVKYTKKFFFITIVPAAIMLYISSYIPAIYDRLVIPVIPFLAIYASISLLFIFSFLQRHYLLGKRLALPILLVALLYYPTTQSFASSWACGQKHVFDQSVEWVRNNIPPNTTFAYKTALPTPSDMPLTGIEMRPTENFSLEEVLNEKAKYAFINLSNVIDYYSGNMANDFFVPPQDLHDNSFVFLSMREYETRAELLHNISRPDMCAEPTLLYYKLPQRLPDATNLIQHTTFNSFRDMYFWHLQQYSMPSKSVHVKYNKEEGHQKAGSIEGRWENYAYTAPRIISDKIAVRKNEAYTVSAWIKNSEELSSNERDGFLRIDFYDDKNGSILLPGISVALSPRTYGTPDWRKLTVTAKAPPNATFMTTSLQVIGVKPTSSFFFDDIEILGPQ